MATSISLVNGAVTCTLPLPEQPEDWRADLDQTRARAMGGRVMVLTRSAVTRKAPVLHWTMLTTTEKESVEAFIWTTCLGSEETFVLTDWNSVTHTCRYLGGLERVASSAPDVWAVDLALVEE